VRRVRIGRGAVVGVRALVFASLGDGAVLGPNSALLADAAPGETLFGTPARPV
jgi:acetyltransferase-like isoleucine patch superfamily enzyme